MQCIGLLVIATGLLCGGRPAIARSSTFAATSAIARTCDAQGNLDETARSFIGRCCKGSINREFPSQWLDKALGEIRAAADRGDRDARKAWKLLSRAEYRKVDRLISSIAEARMPYPAP